MRAPGFAAALAACMLAAVPARAGIFDIGKSKGGDPKLVEKVRDSEEVVKEFMTGRDVEIPKNLLKEAKAVLIFTDGVRAGFIFTGQFAQGIALVKDRSGDWSAPAFFRMSGLGVGLQIGGDVSDAVVVIRDEQGVEQLLEHRFTMGADASAAAGKSGRQLKARTNTKTNMVSYGRSKGLFAGMSFDGAVIKQDTGANRKYYGRDLDARQILLEGKAPVTHEASRLIGTLKRFD